MSEFSEYLEKKYGPGGPVSQRPPEQESLTFADFLEQKYASRAEGQEPATPLGAPTQKGAGWYGRTRIPGTSQAPVSPKTLFASLPPTPWGMERIPTEEEFRFMSPQDQTAWKQWMDKAYVNVPHAEIETAPPSQQRAFKERQESWEHYLKTGKPLIRTIGKSGMPDIDIRSAMASALGAPPETGYLSTIAEKISDKIATGQDITLLENIGNKALLLGSGVVNGYTGSLFADAMKQQIVPNDVIDEILYQGGHLAGWLHPEGWPSIAGAIFQGRIAEPAMKALGNIITKSPKVQSWIKLIAGPTRLAAMSAASDLNLEPKEMLKAAGRGYLFGGAFEGSAFLKIFKSPALNQIAGQVGARGLSSLFRQYDPNVISALIAGDPSEFASSLIDELFMTYFSMKTPDKPLEKLKLWSKAQTEIARYNEEYGDRIKTSPELSMVVNNLLRIQELSMVRGSEKARVILENENEGLMKIFRNRHALVAVTAGKTWEAGPRGVMPPGEPPGRVRMRERLQTLKEQRATAEQEAQAAAEAERVRQAGLPVPVTAGREPAFYMGARGEVPAEKVLATEGKQLREQYIAERQLPGQVEARIQAARGPWAERNVPPVTEKKLSLTEAMDELEKNGGIPVIVTKNGTVIEAGPEREHEAARQKAYKMGLDFGETPDELAKATGWRMSDGQIITIQDLMSHGRSLGMKEMSLTEKAQRQKMLKEKPPVAPPVAEAKPVTAPGLEITEVLTEGEPAPSSKLRGKIVRAINDAAKTLGAEKLKALKNIDVMYVNSKLVEEATGKKPDYYAAMSMGTEGRPTLLIRTDLPGNREVLVHEIAHALGEATEPGAEGAAAKVYPKSIQAKRAEVNKLLEDYKKKQEAIVEEEVAFQKAKKAAKAPQVAKPVETPKVAKPPVEKGKTPEEIINDILRKPKRPAPRAGAKVVSGAMPEEAPWETVGVAKKKGPGVGLTIEDISKKEKGEELTSLDVIRRYIPGYPDSPFMDKVRRWMGSRTEGAYRPDVVEAKIKFDELWQKVIKDPDFKKAKERESEKGPGVGLTIEYVGGKEEGPEAGKYSAKIPPRLAEGDKRRIDAVKLRNGDIYFNVGHRTGIKTRDFYNMMDKNVTSPVAEIGVIKNGKYVREAAEQTPFNLASRLGPSDQTRNYSREEAERILGQIEAKYGKNSARAMTKLMSILGEPLPTEGPKGEKPVYRLEETPGLLRSQKGTLLYSGQRSRTLMKLMETRSNIDIDGIIQSNVPWKALHYTQMPKRAKAFPTPVPPKGPAPEIEMAGEFEKKRPGGFGRNVPPGEFTFRGKYLYKGNRLALDLEANAPGTLAKLRALRDRFNRGVFNEEQFNRFEKNLIEEAKKEYEGLQPWKYYERVDLRQRGIDALHKRRAEIVAKYTKEHPEKILKLPDFKEEQYRERVDEEDAQARLEALRYILELPEAKEHRRRMEDIELERALKEGRRPWGRRVPQPSPEIAGALKRGAHLPGGERTPGPIWTGKVRAETARKFEQISPEAWKAARMLGGENLPGVETKPEFEPIPRKKKGPGMGLSIEYVGPKSEAERELYAALAERRVPGTHVTIPKIERRDPALDYEAKVESAKSQEAEKKYRWGSPVRSNFKRMGDVGEGLANRADDFEFESNAHTSRDQFITREALQQLRQGLNKTGGLVGVPYLKRTTAEIKRLADLCDEKQKPANPEEAAAKEIMNSVFSGIADLAEMSHMTIKTPFGEERPWARRKPYFPHAYTEESLKKFLDMKGEPFKHLHDLYIEEMAKKLFSDLYKQDPQEAIRETEMKWAEPRRDLKSRPFANLEMTRILDEEVLGKLEKRWEETHPGEKFPLERDYSLGMLMRYIAGSHNRIAWIRNFGADIRTAKGDFAPQFIYEAIPKLLNQDNYNYVLDFFSSYLRRSGFDTRSLRFMRDIRTAQLWKLGTAFIPNSMQWLTNTVPLVSTKAGLQGLMDASRLISGNKELREYFAASGARTSRSAIREALGEDASKLDAFASLMLQIHGFSGTEWFNAMASAMMGGRKAIELSEKLSERPEAYRHKAWENELKKLGLKDKDIEEIKRGKKIEMGDPQYLRAMYEMRAMTQFMSDAFHLPKTWSSPQGRLLTQFKNFAYNQTRLLATEPIAEAWKFAKTKGREGDISKLFKAAIILPAVGAIITKAKREGYKAFGIHFYEDLMAGKSWPVKLGITLMNSGSLGLAFDVLGAVGFGTKGYAQLIGGPSASDFGQFISALYNSGKEFATAWRMKSFKWIPHRGKAFQEYWAQFGERISPDLRILIQNFAKDWKQAKTQANWAQVYRDARQTYMELYNGPGEYDAERFWDAWLATQGAEYEDLFGRKPNKPTAKDAEEWWTEAGKSKAERMHMPGEKVEEEQAEGGAYIW